MSRMRKWKPAVLFASATLLVVAAPARAQNQGGVTRFATLPEGAPAHPEGLTADPAGNIYAASFELPPASSSGSSETAAITQAASRALARRRSTVERLTTAATTPGPQIALNYIYVWGSDGHFKSFTALPATDPTGKFPVVPLGMVVRLDRLFVNDVFNGNLIEYQLPLTATSVPLATHHLCGGFVAAFAPPTTDPQTTFCALNANAVGPDGRIYVTDNGAGPDVVGPTFNAAFLKGRIWVFDPGSGSSSIFSDAPELDIGGPSHEKAFPEFGVNGIADARDGSALYFANMSTNVVYKMPLQCGSNVQCTAGSISVFAQGNGIAGPDNMDFDDQGNLWVASGQNDSVVAIDPQGQVTRRVGSFQGFAQDGAPQELLQPSGIIFSKGKIFVGNEANQSLRLDNIDWKSLKLWTISSFQVGQGG